jgi:SAM-dependent methyltransferase
MRGEAGAPDPERPEDGRSHPMEDSVMKNLLIERNDGVRDRAVMVGEKRSTYGEQLDARTDRYLEQLADLERRCMLPDADRERLLDEVTLLNDSLLQACADYEGSAGRDTAALLEARRRFREKTHPMLSKSYFINHARTWPRGYQGDHQMLEGVYRDIPLARGLGYYLDRYSLSTTLAAAVRERRIALRDMLRRELARRTRPAILDIACGSCRELFELAPEIRRSEASVTCLDFDAEALSFASNRMPLSGLDPEQVQFRQYNAIKMINKQRNLKEFGRQDVIYSVGFFDYLQDEVLVRLLGSLYELLAPGGLLITSFKDRERYSSQYYHWIVEWDGFLQRTAGQSRELLAKAGIPDGAVTTFREESQVIIFYNAVRR